MDTNTHNNTEYHTPQQPHRGTEMWGRRESGRALMLAVTEAQVIRQLRERFTDGGHSLVRTRRLRLIWITMCNADTTQNGQSPPPPHTPHPSDYPYSSANAAATPTPTTERAHPRDNNREQPGTAQDSSEKMPGAPRALGDVPTDILQGRGGGGRRLLPRPNCGDAYEGELAPVPNL